MSLTRITAPAPAVSLAEAKLHLRVEHDSEDALIETLIAAATGNLDGKDGILGRALMPQTWRMKLSAFPADDIVLPLPPLISVDSIGYTDSDDAAQTFEDFTVDLADGTITPDDAWPTGTDVVVTFTAGYPGEETDSPPGPNGVPAPIKQAILLLVGHWYANREAVTPQAANELPMAVQWLINPYRRPGVFFA